MRKWQIAQVVNLQTWVRILLNSAIICFIIKRKIERIENNGSANVPTVNYSFYIFIEQ